MRKILLAGFLVFSLPLAAQEPPQCTEAREGQLACMAGKQCACRFIPGGSMTGRPDRFAWDCGINRPNCPPDPNIVQQPGYAPPIGGVYVNPPNFPHTQGPHAAAPSAALTSSPLDCAGGPRHMGGDFWIIFPAHAP